MQTLFDACASRMTQKEDHEIWSLPTPTTVTSFLFSAKSTRICFSSLYEQVLGELEDECFVFTQQGGIVIDRTLANVENSDLKQGFRYNCAFGKKEQLAVIWQKLSDEDKAALRLDHIVIVQFYSALMTAENEVPRVLYIYSFTESLYYMWHNATLNVYRNGCRRVKKDGLFLTWLSAALAKAEFRGNHCAVVCEMQRERDFVYDDADIQKYKQVLCDQKRFPEVESVMECSRICGLQEFEDLVMEVVREMEQ